MDSGIDMAMIRVLRQLPRNSRIISAVRHAAIMPFANHALHRGTHED